MKHIRMVAGICVCLSAGFGLDLYAQEAAGPEKAGTDAGVFKNEPQARALYDQMIEALRRPQSLTYKSDYRWEARGREVGHCTYTVWLKKPNQFRVEGVTANGKHSATLVGDGQTQWLFWSGDRPISSTDDRETYEKTRSNVYMKKPAPPGGHSIGRETSALGVGMGMPILDPSTFFGYTDALQRNVDGVMGIGKEKIGDEECDGIEVSIRKHQGSRYLWLSPKDHLPRKLKEVLRVSQDMIVQEDWSDIAIDGPMPAEKFAWTPPEGWRQWQPPKPEDALLKPGTAAPDFELPLVDGRLVKLSDFRDKIVWFYLWRAGLPARGLPARREEMRYLQKLHEKYNDKGLVILGFNCADDKKIALEFLHENGATFPTILYDASDAAKKVRRDYKMSSGVPLNLNYIIDRQGKVVDTWYGYEEGHARALAALKKAGLKLDEEK
jgi:peroxiredoxin/outer membrane lipoprotein-sorting protein